MAQHLLLDRHLTHMDVDWSSLMKVLILALISSVYSSATFAANAGTPHQPADNLSILMLLAVGVVGLVIARRKSA